MSPDRQIDLGLVVHVSATEQQHQSRAVGAQNVANGTQSIGIQKPVSKQSGMSMIALNSPTIVRNCLQELKQSEVPLRYH